MWFVFTKNKLFTFLILFIVTFFCAYVFYCTAERFPINHVKVYASFKHLEKTELSKVVKPYASCGFIKISLKGLKKSIEALPWVEKATLRRRWPDSIVILIEEKKPIAYWRDKGVVSSRHVVFYPKNLQSLGELPHLYGEDGNEEMVISEYLKIKKILHSIGQSVNGYEINYRYSRMITLKNGGKIILGRSVIFSRLKRFVDVYFAMFHDRFAQISYIDLRYPHGIAVQWKFKSNENDSNRTMNKWQKKLKEI